ncbi:MAG: hypothetical protein IKS94_01055 [Prevotella sp.]|nr:hypothetical protein [Prevotella sp.]
MKDGYIILPRAVLDDDYFAQKFTRAQAYIDLYFLAAYKERTFYIRGNPVTVKRGQVSVSKKNLADRWQWSRNTVQKFLDELQAHGKIEQQKSRIITIISLKNYEQIEQQNEQQNEQPYNKGKLKDYFKEKIYKKENGNNRKNHPTAADNAAEFVEKLRESANS